MKIALAQTQNFLGDFKSASEEVSALIHQVADQASLLLFPEGGLFSYPPKDYLFRQDLLQMQMQEIANIEKQIPEKLGVLLPGFMQEDSHLYNGTFLLEKNKPRRFFSKEFLPDDQVFYESRYFTPGKVKDNYFIWEKRRVQVLICEDLWKVQELTDPAMIICLNASPYTEKKEQNRLQRAQSLSKKYKCPFFYLNRVGAQDEIIFDGKSFVLDSEGSTRWQGKSFEPDFKIYDLDHPPSVVKQKPIIKEEEQELALTLGLRDFCKQLGFSKVHLGLSGGIDSALVLYLAVQALGKENVKIFFLPSPFTEKISHQIVEKISKNSGVPLQTLPITDSYHFIMEKLFSKTSPLQEVTSQNIQARIRSLFLMSEANENASLLLSTGNKSELATGYSTLYGDLSGALLPIGDLFKTEVYNLVQFIQKKARFFPEELLTRAPTAELAPGQKDQDHLPAYSELDPILKNLLNFQAPKNAKENKVATLLKNSEFKRKQSPPILKISENAFGEGRRMPIAHRIDS